MKEASDINNVHTNMHNWCKYHEIIMKNDRDIVVYAYTVIIAQTRFYIFIHVKV